VVGVYSIIGGVTSSMDGGEVLAGVVLLKRFFYIVFSER